MELFFTGQSFCFKGKVHELKAFLQENSGRHHNLTLKEFLSANLN